MPSCTNLEEHPTSSITPGSFYRNEGEVLGGLAGVYSTLRATLWGYYNISQISTDENVVPVRGQDWFDNGKWLEVHRQTWGANSAAGLDLINAAYNDPFTGVVRANALLDALAHTKVNNQAIIEAEVRTLRAFYYYLLMDAFGGVPLVTTTDIKPRAQASRAEIFKFVESELLAVRAALPAKWDAGNWGRVTQGAVDAILASLYLNAEVFTGTVTTAGLQKGTARWQDAVTVADRIINSGTYSLATDFKSNFVSTNQSSPENIFVVRHSTLSGLGLTFDNRALHYNSFNLGGWNGFSTLADTYNSFDANDIRRTIFLVGPQFNLETGKPALDRAGNRLVFTLDIKDITAATEGEGARMYKFPIDPKYTGGDMGNDYPYFRLGEIYLIEAEARNELGQTAAAVDWVNQLRSRDFAAPIPLVAANFTQSSFRDQILKERLFELTGEAKRRQDMIRMGVYTNPFQYKDQREPYRILFPFPQSQLSVNPLLKQNPGY
ncbi:MAG: RagB/SusD family nutrient uptake outer membrane protein [Gemmatimonadaceae bacterium]